MMRGVQRPSLFLIDTFGFLFRAYHARAHSPAPMMRTRSGLPTEAVYIFHNMLRKLLKNYTPTHLAAVFESKEPTVREQRYEQYKANRPAPPEEFLQQLPYVERLLRAMRIPTLVYPQYEADDVIGTIATQAAAQGIDVVIVSSDKDLLQLVDDRIRMYDPAKDIWFDRQTVQSYLGVPPERVPDFLALRGDPIDNIPGAKGIGEKGARELIERFGCVEEALAHAAEVSRKNYRESLETQREQILLSKELARVHTDVPLEWSLEQLQRNEPDRRALGQLFRELEFFSLLKELEDELKDTREHDYRALESPSEIETYLEELRRAERIGVAVQVESQGLLDRVVFGLSDRPGRARVIADCPAVRQLLEEPAPRKAALDAKSALVELYRRGLERVEFSDDPVLYEFLLTAEPSAATPQGVIERELQWKYTAGVDQLADAALEASRLLAPTVEARGLRQLYETIDLPLLPVLARMEVTGIRIDPEVLRRLSLRLASEIEQLAENIYAVAGQRFNINSPQQLSKVLYEDLKLKPKRSGRRRVKADSTAAEVLEAMVDEHPIVRLVLEYRQLTKLKGTYVDPLPELVDPRTGRIHTTFNPTGASTGRLSSSNPNLQNIPIRTELGREIRAAFVPEPGWKLIVADYSQIELRLLAHMSQDPLLVEAFRRGQDIHASTAAEVFGVSIDQVSAEMRRRAKAVNFGIIYGQTPAGLAAQLSIPEEEAEQYIDRYFKRYEGVKRFIDETIQKTRETGQTRTLFGRVRPIPDINSRNPSARAFAERTAINTPLQGTAADLIKLAMIRIDRQLRSDGFRARMLLQVHDELLFEAPPEEVEPVSRIVKEIMEGVYELSVPLVAEIGVGDNWRDAK